uniref:Uncharacterized protein n=1 Tax=Octopus bimaculoides TaxID=37653 RepID=A0A0L8FR13_OCTBM
MSLKFKHIYNVSAQSLAGEGFFLLIVKHEIKNNLACCHEDKLNTMIKVLLPDTVIDAMPVTILTTTVTSVKAIILAF